jgi:hypothetical protein
MAIIWSYEQAGYPRDETFATTLANHAAAWCSEMGCAHNTAEGALSFLAAYSQSARSRIKAFKEGKDINTLFYKPPSYYSSGMHVIQAIHNRPGIDLVPLKRGDLYDVGNISLSNSNSHQDD